MKVVRYAVWTWVAVWTGVLMYFTLMIRTYQYGATPIRGYPLLIGYLAGLSLPILLPFFIAYRLVKRTVVRYVGLCLLTGSTAFLSAEAYASLEEYVFTRECSVVPRTADTVFQNRWWPFEHHYLGYHPESGEFFGGD